MRSRRLRLARWAWPVAALTAWLSAVPAARAHPLGNFAICHYTRLQAGEQKIRLRHVLDLAEVPAVAEKALLDADRDGVVSPAEKAAYLAAAAPRLVAGLSLTVNGRAAALRRVAGEVRLSPGAAGLDTLQIILDLEAPLPPGGPWDVVFRDRNYEARAGWKELVVVGGAGVEVRQSSAPATDRSRELTAYPADAIPPQDTEARFTLAPSHTAGGEPPPPPAADPGPAAAATPRDAFTELIARPDLGPGAMAAGLLIALVFGALHALAPGHGKAMVAAYLVGSRGTAWHAAFLGLLVTVTHTAGVFALGVAALFASRYVVPERFYPLLTVLSGLLISGVGIQLLYYRLRRLLAGPRTAPAGQAAPAGRARHHHHHLPEGPVTARSLLALGVSGGIVPCPSALVVLLAAVALHRIGYGLLLITAFSFGLGSVLVAIGLLVVYARRWLERLPGSRALTRRLSLASAVVITCLGVALVARAALP
jgi:ABC-type nickel/cobalt efflux system permease component RcnA